jgi:hypothetical protein
VCGRKIELEMVELRRQLELTARAQRFQSSEVSRQMLDLATAATECTRKLALLKPRIYSIYPVNGEIAGGTIVSIRGSSKAEEADRGCAALTLRRMSKCGGRSLEA